MNICTGDILPIAAIVVCVVGVVIIVAAIVMSIRNKKK